jgi:inward rectifier potassium channel
VAASGSIVEFLRRCVGGARPVLQGKVFEPGGGSIVVGLPAPGAHDLYHSLLRASWRRTLAIIALAFVLANCVFAALYSLTGGVANARAGSVADLFFFSVETMSTVGYGEMYPASRLAHAVVVVEALCGILLVATTTGLVFAKFSRSTARLIFSRKAVIANMDGVPTLMFRVANARGNAIVAAEFHLVLIRTERNVEGQTIYRMHDLPLVRTRVPTLTRTYLAMHRIEETSLLHGATPQSIERDEVQLVVALVGIDGTTSQTIYAGHDYLLEDIQFGVRFADMLSELPDGRLRVDFSRLDEVVPS